MIEGLARNWWALALRGAFAVLFGIAAIIWPGPTIAVLLGLFGAFLLADGIFAFIGAVRAARDRRTWWTHLAEGLVDVALAIVVFTLPALTALALLYFIAFWAIFIGVWRIAGAIELRREVPGEWLMAATGLFSLLFGVGIALFPGAGALALVVLIGIYALSFGVLSILLALRLRGLKDTMPVEERFRRAA